MLVSGTMLSRVLLGILLWPLTSAAEVWPNPNWLTKTPEAAGIDRALLEQARDYALSGGGSGYVIHRGYLVFSWGDPAMLYEVKSVTKSIGVMALGLAVGDGLLTLGALADENHVDFASPPASNEQTGWIPWWTCSIWPSTPRASTRTQATRRSSSSPVGMADTATGGQLAGRKC